MVVIKEVQPVKSPDLSPDERHLMGEAVSVERGALWVLQAIASNAVRNGVITSESILDGYYIQGVLAGESDRLEEIVPQLRAATELSVEVFGYTRHRAGEKKRPVYTTYKVTPAGIDGFVGSFLIGHFSEFAVSSMEAQEQLKESDVVMVAGHQGVGKGVVTAFLETHGYVALPMSQPVREVTEAWGLRSDGTLDKIVTGQVLKNYFGPDILVHLGLEYLASEGHRQIVIDGPRVIEEAYAVQRMGGKLVGVIAHDDYGRDREIRRSRIVRRAELDPKRSADVGKFDERERIEAGKITAILGLVQPELLFVNGGDNPDGLQAVLGRRLLGIA